MGSSCSSSDDLSFYFCIKPYKWDEILNDNLDSFVLIRV